MDNMEIEVLDDPIKNIRNHRKMYLGRDEVTPDMLVSSIISDALILGAKKLEVRHCGDWWIISSSEDWLGYKNDYSVQDTFKKILPLWGGTVNSFRSEIVLAAFASELYTKQGDELLCINGDGSDKEELLKYIADIPASHRIVAFTLRYIYDLYGFKQDNLEEIKGVIDSTLGICLSEDYIGNRKAEEYKYHSGIKEEFVLTNNFFKQYDKWLETEFSQYPILLYVSGTTRSDEIGAKLMATIEGIELLRHRII